MSITAQPCGQNAYLYLIYQRVLPALCLFAALFAGHPSAYGQFDQELTAQFERSIANAVQATSNTKAAIDTTSADTSPNEDTLLRLRDQLDSVNDELTGWITTLQTRISEIDAGLTELGEPPTDGTEPPIVVNQRNELSGERGRLAVFLTQAREQQQAITIQRNNIAKVRRDAFSQELFKKTPITGNLLMEAAREASGELVGLRQLVANWATFVAANRVPQMLLSLTLSVLLALLLMLATPRLFGQFLKRNLAHETPAFFEKLSIAFWTTILPSLAFAIFFAAVFALFRELSVLTPRMASIVATLFPVLAGIIFIRNLAVAVFYPKSRPWRLIDMPDDAARMMTRLLVLLVLVYGLDLMIVQLSEILAFEPAITIVKSLAGALLMGILLMAMALVRGGVGKDQQADETIRKNPLPWPLWFSIPTFLSGVGIIALAALGYMGLAHFVGQQIIITGGLIAIMGIGLAAGREVGREGVLIETVMGRHLIETRGWEKQSVEQISVALGLGFSLLVLSAGLPLIALQWGARAEDIWFWTIEMLSGFQIGSVRFSLTGILLGLAVFIGGYLLTRMFQRWLDGNVMARSRVDPGMRNSIKTGVGYIGLAIALVFAVTSAGVNLSSLAIVAGALSLGIGFGLQTIVSNFVSGLILLVERPIKVGDFVEASGHSGFVKKISVRATEIETLHRQSVILPNSELINAAVINSTHKDRNVRIDVPIGVAYGSDVRGVQRILLDIARKHSRILKDPEPFVYFAGFGDSSLDFELRFFLEDLFDRLIVQNDVRFAIVQAFEEEGIEIPFPQRDLNIRRVTLDENGAALSVMVTGKPEKISDATIQDLPDTK